MGFQVRLKRAIFYLQMWGGFKMQAGRRAADGQYVVAKSNVTVH